MKSVKKLLFILSIALVISSCGNANRSSETNEDSLRNVHVDRDSLDSVKAYNSIHNIKKGAASTIDSANKMVEKANEKMKDSGK